MARRIDTTHRSVIDALRHAGWYVLDLSQLGRGAPDAICARAGQVRLVEIKDGAKPPSKQRLTPDETKVHAGFLAAGVSVMIVRSAAEAMAL